MNLPPLLLQTAGSLAAILALAGLARWMNLGGTPRLDSADAVRRAAGEVEDGFDPVAFACDTDGAGTLARDAAGRIMLIRRHGNRFAGRVLNARASALLEDDRIIVDCGEPRFGPAVLTFPEAEAWAAAINRLSRPDDA